MRHYGFHLFPAARFLFPSSSSSFGRVHLSADFAKSITAFKVWSDGFHRSMGPFIVFPVLRSFHSFEPPSMYSNSTHLSPNLERRPRLCSSHLDTPGVRVLLSFHFGRIRIDPVLQVYAGTIISVDGYGHGLFVTNLSPDLRCFNKDKSQSKARPAEAGRALIPAATATSRPSAGTSFNATAIILCPDPPRFN